ncbi:hypothetical protein [Micromonospora haikouensis]|uniref:hypothetical protein n=1 Tax=Micromonospora haikouensis TaxID=686309 RepID=UPI003D729325
MPSQPDHIGYCDNHGKRLFSSRKQAKREIRRLPGGAGMREYRCDLVEGHWHIGHLPPAVREGRKTATEVYGGGR